MWHIWGTEEVRTWVWRGDLRKTENMEDLGVDGRIILKCKGKGKVFPLQARCGPEGG